MILAVFAVRVDRGRHTEYPLPQVKVVRALIEKNTAAFACPCSSPSAAVVVRLSSVPVGYDPYASLQLSERTVLYHFAHLLVELVCALVVHDTERLAALLCSFHEGVNALCVNADRLLGKNIQSVFKRVYTDDGMEIVRRRYHNSVNKSALYHLMGVGKIRHAVTANSASPIKSVRLNIADCRKNRAGDFSFKEVSCVSGTHVAETDHTESYFIHCCLRSNI